MKPKFRSLLWLTPPTLILLLWPAPPLPEAVPPAVQEISEPLRLLVEQAAEMSRERPAEALEIVESVLLRIGQENLKVPALEMQALEVAANAAEDGRWYDKLAEFSKRYEARAMQAGDLAAVCRALDRLSVAEFNLWDLPAMERSSRRLLGLAKRLRDWAKVTLALHRLSIVETYGEDLQASAEYTRQALEAARKSERADLMATVQRHLIGQHLVAGRYEEALIEVERALKQTDSGRTIALLEVKRAVAARETDRLELSKQSYEKALKLLEEHGDRPFGFASLHLGYGDLEVRRGEMAVAAGHYRRAADFFIEAGVDGGRVQALTGLMGVRRVQGRMEEAAELVAMLEASEMEQKETAMRFFEESSKVYEDLGRLAAALEAQRRFEQLYEARRQKRTSTELASLQARLEAAERLRSIERLRRSQDLRLSADGGGPSLLLASLSILLVAALSAALVAGFGRPAAEASSVA